MGGEGFGIDGVFFGGFGGGFGYCETGSVILGDKNF